MLKVLIGSQIYFKKTIYNFKPRENYWIGESQILPYQDYRNWIINARMDHKGLN